MLVLKRKFLAVCFAVITVSAAFASASVPKDDEIVSRIYTLENAMEVPISELYVYETKGENLVPNGLKPGEQVKVTVGGHYLRTPNQTLYTVEFVAKGITHSIKTLHVEDLFNVLYLTGADAVSGATAVSFTNLDGTPQKIINKLDSPVEGEIATRVYTLENAMKDEITELYVYRSKGENFVPNGLKPGEQVKAEVIGYYLRTPNQTLYTVEFKAGETTFMFKTLHVEDLFEILYLKGTPNTDAVSGATPVSFKARV